MKSNPPKRGKEAKEKKEMDISKTAYGTPKSKFNLGQVREFIFKVFRTPSRDTVKPTCTGRLYLISHTLCIPAVI